MAELDYEYLWASLRQWVIAQSKVTTPVASTMCLCVLGTMCTLDGTEYVNPINSLTAGKEEPE